ncbi:MAG TPA: queuosine precursor transporter [Saprospiraceae bacterium]|nr:queuosine precursor transporter [Saprospiraceae bacterium]
MPKFLQSKAQILFIFLAGFFVVNAIVAEFIGIKIFSLEKTLGIDPFSFNILGQEGLSFNLTAGVLLWPVVFVMTDLINEYYGPKAVRFLSWMAVGLIIYAFFMVFTAIAVTPNDWWNLESGKLDTNPANHIFSMNLAFKKVMGQGLWIIIGSVIAFLVGQIIDVLIFHRIKKVTGDKRIWLRATGSTLVSQLIDSYIVLIFAFYIGSDWELSRVLAIGTVNYIYKFVMAFLLTPVIYAVHAWIENYLGKDQAQQMKLEAMGNE